MRSDNEWEQGDRVRFHGISDEAASFGGCDDPRISVVAGRTYTIRRVEVHKWHTRIRLDGHPDRWFNSVGFTILPRDGEVLYALDQVLDDPHTHPDLKRGIREIRAMGFEPEVARQGDLDQDQRTHWDRLHDAAGLPRRTDLTVPPRPIELPPDIIMLVLAKTVHQCNVSFLAGQGKPYVDSPSDETLKDLVFAIRRFVEKPDMTGDELYPEGGKDHKDADAVTIKAIRFALTLAGINL